MSRNSDKASKAVRGIVGFLQSEGFPYAEARPTHGAYDRGDIAGVPSTVIEVKNAARVELAEWVKEAVKERDNDGAAWGVVWHKKRGTQFPGQWYVTMTGADFTALLRAAHGLEDTP